jgi:3,4-dihydroxy 2-butanone 4-phosphate synthase/GTP cyclohydrolase II
MTGRDEPRASEGEIIERVRRRLELAHRSQRPLPYITMTYAQSLDGSIARPAGETIQLSNPLSRRLTHQIRSVHDAILVGINTVLRDNPRLNVRLVPGRDPQPVVIDSRLRLPLDACLMHDPCVRPIVFAGLGASSMKERRLSAAGARVVRVAERDDRLLDLAQVFARLRHMGIRSVMVEGGASIITSILMSRLADQCLLTISPRFLGGLCAVQPRNGSEVDHLPRLKNLHYQWLAEDLILHGDLECTAEEEYPWPDEPFAHHDPSPVTNAAPENGKAESR